MVWLTHAYDRDVLFQNSPHVFDNVLVSFNKHDRGRNWRSAEFNHECWMLLLDFPRDYLSERHIYQAIGEFAKVLLVQLVEGACKGKSERRSVGPAVCCPGRPRHHWRGKLHNPV